MKSIISKLSRFLRDEEGLELSEYAVAGALLVLGTLAAFTLLGGNITTAINAIAGVVGTAGTAAP